jgi:hypothetical protein
MSTSARTCGRGDAEHGDGHPRGRAGTGHPARGRSASACCRGLYTPRVASRWARPPLRGIMPEGCGCGRGHRSQAMPDRCAVARASCTFPNALHPAVGCSHCQHPLHARKTGVIAPPLPPAGQPRDGCEVTGRDPLPHYPLPLPGSNAMWLDFRPLEAGAKKSGTKKEWRGFLPHLGVRSIPDGGASCFHAACTRGLSEGPSRAHLIADHPVHADEVQCVCLYASERAKRFF